MNKINALLVLLALIFAGCSGSTSVDHDDHPPITLHKMGVMAKTTGIINEMEALPYDIKLDTISMTASFYFIIKNNSNSEITGLKFAFDKPHFKITPDSIITLGVPSSSTGIEQLIKVTVEHGTLAGGLGWADILTGDQYGELTISGKNTNGDFSTTYTMHVFAKRMVAYIEYPDSIYEHQGGETWAYKANINSNGYIYTDNASKGCYINFYANGSHTPPMVLTGDTDTLSYSNAREFFTLDGTYTYISNTTMELYKQIIREERIFTIYDGEHEYEKNCVTYVIDTRKNGITKILK